MKIALISLNQFWEDKEKNLDLCLEFINKASKEKVDLIIFPEMTLTGFSTNIKAIAEDKKDSKTIKLFSEIAKNRNLAIIFGVVIKEENKASNNCYFIDNFGKIQADYKKIHPFSFAGENVFYVAGDELKSVLYKDHQIGFSICYDLRFPEIYTALSKNNDIIVNIANWPKRRVEHWDTLLRARAIENQVFVIGVNRIGVDGNNLEYQKSSKIYNSNGEELASLIRDGDMEIFDIDKNYTAEFRKKFNTIDDRKTEFYKNIL